MNFSQLAINLNMTRAGARALVLRNENKIKKYLIYENKKIVGVKDDAIEDIRNLVVKTTNISYQRDKSIDSLKLEIEFLNRLLNEKDKNVIILQNEINDLKELNTKLFAELDYYRSRGLFAKLLTFKTNQKN